MAGEGFYNDHRYCRHCTKFYPLDVSWNKIYCICCHRRLANKPKSRKGKALLNGIHRY